MDRNVGYIVTTFTILVSLTRGKQYAAHTRHRCIPDLTLAWSREISTGPIASTPLIADVDADGKLDIVATSFSGSIHVVQARDGFTGQSSHWPYRLNHATIHAGPLQYDFDHNGLLDLLITTTNGELFFLDGYGNLIRNSSFQLGKLMVDRDWHKKRLTVSQLNIHDYILDESSLALPAVNYVEVDPHILATGVIDDLNQDGVTEELVIPVSYYFDLDDYSDPEYVIKSSGLTSEELENYLVGALVFFNLTSMTPLFTVHLDLTKVSSEYPAYILATPTIADLIASQVGLEIAVGTSAGHLHLIDHRGHFVEPFPLPTESIHTQVTVEDINNDGKPELIVQDSSNHVICFDVLGQRLWETEVPGVSTFGTRVTDVNDDGTLDVVLTSDTGHFWVLAGDTGRVMKGWPMHMGQSFTSPPLITRMHRLHPTVLVGLSREGVLHLLTTDTLCRHSFGLGETTLVPLASHDLLPSIPGVEFLVATGDGVLMCLMQGNVTRSDELGDSDDDDATSYLAWPSETKTHNDFTFLFDQLGLWIDRSGMKDVPEHTKTTFHVTFTIADFTFSSPYHCQVLLGSILLADQWYESPEMNTLIIDSPSRPLVGHLVVSCRTQTGKILRDAIAVRFHTTVLYDLQWLFICPTLATLLLLLFLYGFPAVDILPITTNAKQR